MPEFVDIIDEQWMANYFRVLIMDVSEDDNSHPVSHNPEDPNDFMKLFDIITYQKGQFGQYYSTEKRNRRFNFSFPTCSGHNGEDGPQHSRR